MQPHDAIALESLSHCWCHSIAFIPCVTVGVSYNIDVVSKRRIKAIKGIEREKASVPYNKKVKSKSFQSGDLVWKTILPLGTKNNNQQVLQVVSKLGRTI
jgi:hypothetical protein